MKLPEKLPDGGWIFDYGDTNSVAGVLNSLTEGYNQLIDYLEEQPTYADGYKQGKFDVEMDRLNKTTEEREGEKPTFSEAYKNKTEEQMLEVARRATLLQNATYTSDDGWHITIPKPEEWVTNLDWKIMGRDIYLKALSDASKASGILFKLED